jgi:hypothetical protein
MIVAKFEKKLQVLNHLDVPLVGKVKYKILAINHIYYSSSFPFSRNVQMISSCSLKFSLGQVGGKERFLWWLGMYAHYQGIKIDLASLTSKYRGILLSTNG